MTIKIIRKSEYIKWVCSIDFGGAKSILNIKLRFKIQKTKQLKEEVVLNDLLF